MPLQLAVTQPADRVRLVVAKVRDQPHLGPRRRGPFGAHDAFEGAEAGAEIGEFVLGERLTAEEQYRMPRPEVTDLRERVVVKRLPQTQPQHLTGEAVAQSPGFEEHARQPPGQPPASTASAEVQASRAQAMSSAVCASDT